MSRVRAKFTVSEVTLTNYGAEKVTLTPDYDDDSPEDQRFSAATPVGKFMMDVTNKALHGTFRPGQAYYIDLTAVS